jgi:hypothetical protein
MHYSLWIFLSAALIVPFNDGYTQNRVYFTRGSIAVIAGIWKPFILDKYPSKPLRLVEGSYPIGGISFMTPTLESYAIRVTTIQWLQKDFSKDIGLESVTLRHLSFDLICFIITQSRIGPFISLGPAIIWSREVPRNSPKDKKIPLDRAGYGVNVGTGLEIQLGQHSGLAVEYQYLYCKFANKVGLTNNYSGPFLSLKVIYLF